MDICPNNTTAQYVTKLPKHIELSGDWRVSLKEISIPMTLVNIGWDTHTLQIMNKETGRVEDVLSLPGTMYINVSTVVSALNKLTQQKYSIAYFYLLNRQEGERKIRIDVNSFRYVIRLNTRLSSLLGFDLREHDFDRGRHLADNLPKIPGLEQLHNLYVYTDIVENVIVSDVTAPLLRIVDITRDIRRMMMHTIINIPLFVLSRKNPSIPFKFGL